MNGLETDDSAIYFCAVSNTVCQRLESYWDVSLCNLKHFNIKKYSSELRWNQVQFQLQMEVVLFPANIYQQLIQDIMFTRVKEMCLSAKGMQYHHFWSN